MFDMLLESGHRPSLVPSWGKGVAVTLHVLVLSALWPAPAPPTPVHRVKYIEVLPPEPLTSPRHDGPLPPVPGPIADFWKVPPLDPPPISLGVLSRPDTEITRVTAPPGGGTAVGLPGDLYPESLVQEAPELLSAPTPVYPSLLRVAGIQGRVIVTAVIDTLGQAENGSVRIVRSDNPGFDAAALATIRAARFRPARIYGRAVRVLVQVPVDFRLH